MTEERALLLTDVVDSTQLSQQIGDVEMARLWAAHDRIARGLLPPWRGREIDKTDGMLLMFDAAADAAQYALAYHCALATLPVSLKARAGLHFGSVILRENPPEDVARGAKPLEVDGLSKPTAARVMSLAMGGQTLLTAAAREALGVTELRIQSHGHWRLKGVTEPIELFELGDAQAPFTPPPDGVKATRVVRSGDFWLPVRQIDNNLPQQVTSFVGRRHELGEVVQSLSTTRLLTLLGIGGLGKTRLALQVANVVMADYPDGVWLAELAPLSDERQVVQAVASALRVKEVTGLTVLEALVQHVKGRQLLIVLDNCEHLLGACATLARQLLESAPDLKLLATSRERLRTAGEAAYPLPTLPVPEAHGALTPASLAQNDAARLFSERAQAVRPGFAIDSRNAVAVADICRHLDGIPFALELAAARMRALPVEVIARRLQDRFHLLSGGERTALPRQQTLRALIDWSHDLLAPSERVLLRRLAVFAGGWTLEAAEAVGSGGEIAAEEVLDLLCQLVDKSLVLVEARAERYSLLETVRAYAQERLVEAGEGGATRTRHLAFFLTLAGQAAPELWGTDQEVWVKRLDRERENILVAHTWCDDDGGRATQGLRLMAKLQLYWLPSGLLELGYRITLEALARPAAGSSTEDRCGALYAASQLAFFLGRFRETTTHGEQSLAIAREIGDGKRAVDALLFLGYAADELGDRGSALGRYEASIELAREIGDKARLSYALNAMAGYHMPTNPRAALPLYDESVALAREAGDRDSVAVTLQNSARSLVALDRGDRARTLLLESLEIAAEIGATRTLLCVLDVCIMLAAQRMEWEHAARFLAAANSQLERLSLRRVPSDETLVASPVAHARAAIGEMAFADVMAAAQVLNLEQVVAEARVWLSRQA